MPNTAVLGARHAVVRLREQLVGQTEGVKHNLIATYKRCVKACTTPAARKKGSLELTQSQHAAIYTPDTSGLVTKPIVLPPPLLPPPTVAPE